MAQIEGGSPAKIFRLDVIGTNFKFHTGIPHLSHIGQQRRKTADGIQLLAHQ